MSGTHELQYKGKKVKITVAKTSQGKQVGTISVADTDPPLRGTGADANTAEEALHNAERKAKEMIDQRS